jgi:hypothetical protein
MWEGCTSRVAVAGTISVLLLTLAACWAFGRSVSSGLIGSAVVFELSRGPIGLRVVSRAMPGPLPTHEPSFTEPLSHLASARYQAICPSQGSDEEHACAIGNYTASGRGSLQPCTPDSLRRWDGKGSWYMSKGGHYTCEPLYLFCCIQMGPRLTTVCDAGIMPPVLRSAPVMPACRYEPSHCRLRRLDVRQARQCLDRKHLAFVSA